MGILDVQIKAQLDNIIEISLSPQEDWHFKVRCINCQETNPNVIYFNLEEEKVIQGSKGSAHYIAKCSFCSREGNIQYINHSWRPYQMDQEFQTIAKFECRGIELIEFIPGNGWHAKALASDTEFDGIDLNDDWAAYDDEADNPVGIYEVKTQVIKGVKK